ncbi:uncharacterized protein KZ484_020500 [Pholidichthys leucotaenia]
MSSVQHPSEFLKEPQTAAAEEILSEFEETTEERKSLRTDFPEQPVNETGAFADQQLFYQERPSNVNQENPETLQIKEEHEELQSRQIKEEPDELVHWQIKEEQEERSISPEVDHQLLKLEPESFMVIVKEESDEPEPNNDCSDAVMQVLSKSKEIHGDVQKAVLLHGEDTDFQCRLLDGSWKPEMKLHRLDAPQKLDCKEELPIHLHHCNQEGDPAPNQKEHSAEIKEEELCITQVEEWYPLKQETDTFMVTPTSEDSAQIKEEELCTTQKGAWHPLKQETDVFLVTPTYEENDDNESDPNSTELLSDTSDDTESQDKGARKNVDLELANYEEKKTKKRLHIDNINNSLISKNQCNTDTAEKLLNVLLMR